MPGTWQDLELGAPEIARLGRDRINAARVALLGTLRADASPRISPVEPYFVRGQLLVGAMTWSGKAADLLRDPRYVLHSAVTGPDSGEGELKLYGSAVEAGQELRDAAAGAPRLPFDRMRFRFPPVIPRRGHPPGRRPGGPAERRGPGQSPVGRGLGRSPSARRADD